MTAIYNPYADRDKIRALIAFAAAVVDNLAPELNAIEATATRLSGSSSAAPRQRDDLQVIIASTKTAIRALTYLSSISSHRRFKSKVLHVGEVLGSLHFLLARLVGSSVQVEIAYAEDLWPVRTDHELLEDAILTLSANARDAMAAGGTLKWSAVNLTVTAGDMANQQGIAAGDYVTIAAVDTGYKGVLARISHRRVYVKIRVCPSRPGAATGRCTYTGM